MKSIFLAVAIVLFGCGERQFDPTKPVDAAFEVKGQHIVVTGKLKPGAKVSKAEAESVVNLAVDLLEKQ